MSACRQLFTFLPRQEQVVLLEFGDLHSRTVVSASISWKTSSSGFAGCGVWRQGRTCLIPANFLESRMGITSAWFGEYVTNSLENRFADDPIFWVRLDTWVA